MIKSEFTYWDIIRWSTWGIDYVTRSDWHNRQCYNRENNAR